MKTKIHPELHRMVVRCACGATYELDGSAQQLQVEICRNCSPLFTGTEEKRIVMGQVEKFLKRKAKHLSVTASGAKKVPTPKKQAKTKRSRPKAS